jgi:hypothetical protein
MSTQTKEEVLQGQLLPGRDDAICALIFTAEDVVTAFEVNGQQISEERARRLLESYGPKVTDAFLYDWTTTLFEVLDGRE